MTSIILGYIIFWLHFLYILSFWLILFFESNIIALMYVILAQIVLCTLWTVYDGCFLIQLENKLLNMKRKNFFANKMLTDFLRWFPTFLTFGSLYKIYRLYA